MQNINQVQNNSSNLPENGSNGSIPSVAVNPVTSGNQVPPQSFNDPTVISAPVFNALPSQPVVTQIEKMYGILSYLPFVHFVTLVLKPESAFVRLHARQGILLFLLFFFSGIVAALFSTFGLIGGILSFFIAFMSVATVILAVYSMYLAALGIWWKIPLLGTISEIIPIELFAKIVKENVTDQVIKPNGDNNANQNSQNSENDNPSST